MHNIETTCRTTKTSSLLSFQAWEGVEGTRGYEVRAESYDLVVLILSASKNLSCSEVSSVKIRHSQELLVFYHACAYTRELPLLSPNSFGFRVQRFPRASFKL